MRDILDVPDEIQAALALIRENRDRLESAMVKTPGFSQKHASAAGTMAQALKALSTEARLWAEQATERAKLASEADKVEACIRFLTKLPVGLRSEAYKELTAAEADAVGSLPLRLGT